MKRRLISFSQVGLLGLALLLILVSNGCTLNAFERVDQAQEGEAEQSQVETPPTPSPEFSPDQVVRIQLEALQHNDRTNKGIEAAFNFASPGNKQFTGPLPRFIKMLKAPPYNSMLNHRSVEYGPIEIIGGIATQRVTLTGSDGQAIIYIFSLSKQTEEPYQDCWMTDGVAVEPTKELPEDQA